MHASDSDGTWLNGLIFYCYSRRTEMNSDFQCKQLEKYFPRIYCSKAITHPLGQWLAMANANALNNHRLTYRRPTN